MIAPVIAAIGAGVRVERPVAVGAILIPAAAPWLIACAVIGCLTHRRCRIIGWRRRGRRVDRSRLHIGRLRWLAECAAEKGACGEADHASRDSVAMVSMPLTV